LLRAWRKSFRNQNHESIFVNGWNEIKKLVVKRLGNSEQQINTGM